MPDSASTNASHAPAVRVRRADARDVDALVALENATFAHDRMPARQWRHHVRSTTALVLVASADGEAAGAAVVFFRRGTNVARLYSIAVAASQRGRGIGQALLAAVERAAVQRGCRAVRLEVHIDNPAAQRMYEAAGYLRFGTIAAYYEDGADALRYEKALRGRATRTPAARRVSPVRS